MEKHGYRDSASFGKRQEYTVVAELLRHNFDVYMTLVDDQGIDCIIRLDHNRYVDIQIKARSKTAQQWNFFAAMKIEPQDNYFFIFYLESNDTMWVMPSNDVVRYSIMNKSGANAGKFSLTLPKSNETEKAKIFSKYKGENGLELLKNFKPSEKEKTG
jgi:hypothetical protein